MERQGSMKDVVPLIYLVGQYWKVWLWWTWSDLVGRSQTLEAFKVILRKTHWIWSQKSWDESSAPLHSCVTCVTDLPSLDALICSVDSHRLIVKPEWTKAVGECQRGAWRPSCTWTLSSFPSTPTSSWIQFSLVLPPPAQTTANQTVLLPTHLGCLPQVHS